MNILIVTPYFPPQTGGVATYIDSLQRFLKQKGHQVYILPQGTSHVISPRLTTTNALVYDFYMRLPWVPCSPVKGLVAFLVYFFPTLLQLRRFLKGKAIDLTMLEYPMPYMYYLYLLKLLNITRLIVGIHGDDILSLHLTPKSEQWLVKQVIKRADWLLAHSSSLMSQAEILVGGLNDNRSYIPCGIELDRLRALSECQTGHSLLSSRPYILTVAKLYGRKGLDVLLQAIKRLGVGVDGYRFVIVGDGPEEQALKQLALELGIQDKVVFTGELQVTEISHLYRHCEFFVLPSRSEPFGIVLLEAMTFGKAIIATRVGGIPEFINHGHNGLLVAPNDSDGLAKQIRRMISDPELRWEIGRNGLTTVEEKYDYGVIIGRYEKLFQSILGTSSPISDSDDAQGIPS
jgi:glycosyltransferase involved in cell wall biosynthesis